MSTLLLLAILLATHVDGLELMRRCQSADDKNAEMERRYVYQERTETRMLDAEGKVKSTQSETFETVPTGGRPYRRRIAKNDVPVAQPDEKKHKAEAQATEEERRRRHRELALDALNAFDMKVVGEDDKSWILEATPKLGFQPHSRETAVLKHFRGRIWISKKDYVWTKLDAEAIDEVSYGLVLVRLEPGAHLVIERTLVNGEVWLPKRITGGGAARVLLLKKLRMEMETTCSKYQRYSANSRMVSESVK
jgi:hypothetical protein